MSLESEVIERLRDEIGRNAVDLATAGVQIEALTAQNHVLKSALGPERMRVIENGEMHEIEAMYAELTPRAPTEPPATPAEPEVAPPD